MNMFSLANVGSRNMASIANDLKEAKKILRKEMKRKIAAVPHSERALQSKQITEKILSMPEYVNASSISLYLSMSDEVDTTDILKDALKKKTVYIPRYFSGGNFMEMLQLRSMEEFEALPLTKWNIKQHKDDDIRPEALEHGLDVMLVPGLAFTIFGARMGRGAGYYDTYLSKASKKAVRPFTVALAFKEQIVSDLPMSDHDFYIDRVIF